MNNNKDPHLERFHELLKTADKLETVSEDDTGGLNLVHIDQDMFDRWINKSLDTILSALGDNGSHYLSFKKYHSDYLNDPTTSFLLLSQCTKTLSMAAEAYKSNIGYDTPNPYLSRYEELLEMAEEIQKTYKEEPGISGVTRFSEMLEPVNVPGEPFKKVDGEMYGEWLNSSLDLIRKTHEKESPHYISFKKHHSSFLDNHYPSYESFRASLAALKSARKAYEFNLQFSGNETSGSDKNADAEIDLPKIAKLIHKHFNKDEIKLLCFKVGERFDDLGTENLNLTAYELTDRMIKRNRKEALIDCIVEERPNLVSFFNT